MPTCLPLPAVTVGETALLLGHSFHVSSESGNFCGTLHCSLPPLSPPILKLTPFKQVFPSTFNRSVNTPKSFPSKTHTHRALSYPLWALLPQCSHFPLIPFLSENTLKRFKYVCTSSCSGLNPTLPNPLSLKSSVPSCCCSQWPCSICTLFDISAFNRGKQSPTLADVLPSALAFLCLLCHSLLIAFPSTPGLNNATLQETASVRLFSFLTLVSQAVPATPLSHVPLVNRPLPAHVPSPNQDSEIQVDISNRLFNIST